MISSKKITFNEKLSHDICDDLYTGCANGLHGHVSIYDELSNGRKILVDKANLVVYNGRKWLAQRAFNKHNISSGMPIDAPNYYISWFGAGSGGATVGDILSPVSPITSDTNLTSPVLFDNNNALYKEMTNNGTYQLKTISNSAIGFSQDPSNDNEYLISQIQMSITSAEMNGPNNGSSATDWYNISEVGLYISDSNDVNVVTDESISLFARCTFSTIRKESQRQLTFIWNIYF